MNFLVSPLINFLNCMKCFVKERHPISGSKNHIFFFFKKCRSFLKVCLRSAGLCSEKGGMLSNLGRRQEAWILWSTSFQDWEIGSWSPRGFWAHPCLPWEQVSFQSPEQTEGGPGDWPRSLSNHLVSSILQRKRLSYFFFIFFPIIFCFLLRANGQRRNSAFPLPLPHFRRSIQ